MKSLSQNDLQTILLFVRSLYAPCSIDKFPIQILTALPELVGAETFAIGSFKIRGTPFLPRFYAFPDPEVGMAAESFTSQRQKFFTHPVAKRYVKTLDGQALAISDFFSESEFQRREAFYAFFQSLGLKDQMAIHFELPSIGNADQFHQGQDHLVLTINRDRRNFTERDRLILNLIRPQLEQAYQNIAAFTQVQEQLSQLNQATEQVGLIALFLDGKVEWISQKAGELLHKYCPLSKLPNLLPEILQRWINHQISLLKQSTEIPSPMSPLYLEYNGTQLTVRLNYHAALERVYLLLEEIQPHVFSVKYLEMLGLTKREAEVLFWVARDRSTHEISKQLGMSDRTVKKHLENIYKKFDVQSRLGGVMYALQKLGIINL
ncbi:helix-turn-helix transcriptional regulator [Nostoc sp. UCD121]|uniref:response regulator transcription factor n=1 Tax=Nostoc sp. UCD121 TaxID=2681305 RepID=UPI0016235536|nr:helix-turn-helix transcriptional regulator [Nostoc sp. UCD121]MBC1221566.1 helix-turn-helix transcriptional regulator [Nostoc sp. UCD120]MBC1276208.1 helix-turn-helix transcriptional regulator [Nostoc sp. UCD121]MBC1294747.1 helix-turn-helix transcriptional regulator [Nostoc sp. UCD122]